MFTGPLKSLKVIVEHPRMTNQAHPFRFLGRVRPDKYSAPGANHLELWRDTFHPFPILCVSLAYQKLAFLNKVHPMEH